MLHTSFVFDNYVYSLYLSERYKKQFCFLKKKKEKEKMADVLYSPFMSGGFYSLIEQWQQFGVFTVLLPLVLVFAIVFAILEKINILNNKGVHLVIALAIGFFTVSNPYVSSFFLPLFSNLGLGIGIVLVLIILVGLAIKPDSGAFKWIFGIVGGIIFIVILGRTGMFKYMLGDDIGYWISMNSSWLVLIIFLVLIAIGVMVGAHDEKGKTMGERLLGKKVSGS